MVAVAEVSKQSLRKYALTKRKNIYNKKVFEEKIKEKVLSNYQVKELDNILIYVSFDDEVDTIEIIKELWNLNKNVYVPKVENDVINFYLIKNFKDLKLGHFKILEPTTNIKYKDEKACIIVPGLLFDKNNNRLGYGGGYYDKFLENKNIYKIGICFSTFVVDKIICNDKDIKMDEIITER